MLEDNKYRRLKSGSLDFDKGSPSKKNKYVIPPPSLFKQYYKQTDYERAYSPRENDSNDYGEFIDSKISLNWKKRSYEFGIFYQPHNQAGGISFSLFGFK